jgi:predicted transcriptional regulator
MSAVSKRRPIPVPRVQVNLGLDPSLKARITELSIKRQVPESQLIRAAIGRFLTAEERRG